jgi:pyruvate dehydrogenase E2 component (dihydrolipoamide acetyltransferase)
MTGAGGTLEVTVPAIGDFGDVPVIEILVSPGDEVAAEDPLVTLESDKATMDVPSPSAGTVGQVRVKVGDRVSEGSTILTLEPAAGGSGATAESKPAAEPAEPEPAATAEPEPAARAQPEPAATPEPPDPAKREPVAAANGHAPVYASPSVRRLARELGIDLHDVSGSGRKGRIVPDDVRAASHGGASPSEPERQQAPAGDGGLGLAPWPVVNFEQFGPIERVDRSRIQRLSGAALARNWVRIPHVTQNDEADITDLEAWRKQLNAERSDGVKFTMVSFLVAACVASLKEFPTFNSSLDGEQLVLRRYYNIGFAADTPGGLVVPVIKNADQKGLVEIARELAELSGTARAGKLTPGDMSGGTFTISSLGGIGGTSFTPIINAPEVAILGVTRAATKPVWDAVAGTFVPRLILPLSLSYDHRVIDGAAAARFVVHLAGVLHDLRRVLL